jgi:acetyl esterase/lipase
MRHALSIVVVLGFSAPSLLFAQQAQRDPLAQAFALPGIELSEAQQAEVAKVREAYTPKLTAVSERLAAVYTREQRQARRQALEKARGEGKSRQEAQAEIDKAVKLSDEQQTKLAALQKEQADLLAEIRGKLRELLTDEQRRQLVQRGRQPAAGAAPRIRPTHANVQYGPHERNVMDVWLAKADQPTPVLVSIHGGGFRGGNKSVDPAILQGCLESGISVVAITYRLSDVAIAPAQHFDAARAIQFTRSKAKEWNLDPKRFAATGGSAGAGLSLWLGFHDDLADATSDDPVLRESSRLSCMAVFNGQTSYDPRFIRDLFPGTDTYQHPALSQLYDVDLTKLDSLPKEKYQLFEQISAINHLSKDDAPALLAYATNFDTPISSQGVGIHHPKFGKVLKEKMDPLGIECQVHTGVRRGEDSARLTLDFIKKHLK